MRPSRGGQCPTSGVTDYAFRRDVTYVGVGCVVFAMLHIYVVEAPSPSGGGPVPNKLSHEASAHVDETPRPSA